LLDAVGALATVAVAYVIQYLLTAQHPFAAAPPVPEPSPG
jgi:hypothetical protein